MSSIVRWQGERGRGGSGCLNCILQFKFARKLARPPDCVRGRWMRFWELSSLLIFWFGRAGGYGQRLFQRRRSWATAGSARTRQGTLGSLEPPFAAASSDEGRCEPGRRRKPLPQWRSAVASNHPCARNASQRASADHRRAARVPYCASAVVSVHRHARVWNPAVRSRRVTVGKRVWRYFCAEAAPCCLRMTRISAPSSVRCSFASANSR